MAEVAARGVGAKVRGTVSGWIKGAIGLVLGVGSGAAVMYSNAIVDRVIKPSKPLANFAVAADGLNVTCQNHAAGESGWWDFGDGSPLEAFDPAQPAVAHAYPKPGNYSVKLTVRNFLAEENDRSVAVDLTTPPQTLPPAITGLTVDALGGRSTAPAAFVVRGTAANVTQVVFDCTGKVPSLDIAPGAFEKFVVFDTPGVHDIRLIGLNGKQPAAKEERRVTVDAAAAGSLSAVVYAVDSGTQTDTRPDLHVEPVPVPKGADKTFTRALRIPAGTTVADAQALPVKGPQAKAVKSVRVDVAADKKSATLAGEWAGTPEQVAKLAGGSDVMVPVRLTLQGPTRDVKRPPVRTAAAFDPAGVATVSLPPAPLPTSGLARTYKLEIVMPGAGGKPVVVHTADPLALPATFAVPNAGAFTAKLTAAGKLEVRRGS